MKIQVITGQRVQSLSPEPANSVTGQIWYNTSSQILRFKTVIGSNAWATSNPLNVLRKRLGGAGTQTAGLAFGGTPASGQTQKTNEYNGSSWTASNDINYAAGNSAGLGTQTAALAFGGQGTNPGPPSITNVTEKFISV